MPFETNTCRSDVVLIPNPVTQCNASFNPYLLPGHKVLSADAHPVTSAVTEKKKLV